MSQLTSNNVAKALIKLVAADSLSAVLGQLVVGNLVTRQFEPVVVRADDEVDVHVPVGGIHTVPVKLSTHATASFTVPDVTKVLAVPDLLQLYAAPAWMALAEKIESDLLGLYPHLTSWLPVGEADRPLIPEVITAAADDLYNPRMLTQPVKYLVLRNQVYSQVRKFPKFAEYESAQRVGLRNLVEGPVGKLEGFHIFRSPHVHVSYMPERHPPATHNLAFTKAAFGLVMRRLPEPPPSSGALAEYAELGDFGLRVLMHHQPNTLRQEFTVDLLYGVGVLRNNQAVEVRS